MGSSTYAGRRWNEFEANRGGHHFALVVSDEVGLLQPDVVNVLLILFSVDPNQPVILNSFEL
jgi:hypothetical protein